MQMPGALTVDAMMYVQELYGDKVDDTRFDKATQLVIKGLVEEPLPDGHSLVVSEVDPTKAYEVDITAMECACPDWMNRRNLCKHIIAVALRDAVRAGKAPGYAGEGD